MLIVLPYRPDNLAIEISAYVQGNDERGRMIRRTLVRYINILSVLTFQVRPHRYVLRKVVSALSD